MSKTADDIKQKIIDKENEDLIKKQKFNDDFIIFLEKRKERLIKLANDEIDSIIDSFENDALEGKTEWHISKPMTEYCSLGDEDYLGELEKLLILRGFKVGRKICDGWEGKDDAYCEQDPYLSLIITL